MKLNVGVIVAIAVALLVSTKGVKWWNKASDESLMQRSVQAVRSQLPRPIQEGVVETRIDLVGTSIQSRYTIEPMFQTDPETTAAFTKAVKSSICRADGATKALEMGYTFDRTYEVRTPHGPDTFHVVADASDCPGVVVKK